MSSAIEFNFTQKPSLLLSYTKGLFWRRHGLKRDESIPGFFTSWKGLKIKKKHVKEFNIQCGLPKESGVSILYPLTLLFPVFMRIMSHRKFPFNYVTMLQLRNHVIYHKQIDINDTLDISSEIIAHRYAEKGIEIDIQSFIEVEGELYWENINTYFFPQRSKIEASPFGIKKISPKPEYEDERNWPCLPRSGWKWARISGDYNGIHYTKLYAKMMGFKSDFIHPHRLLTYILYNTPKLNNSIPQMLNIALKGPVFYETNVNMKIENIGNNTSFDLYCSDNPRPSICVEMISGAFNSKLA